MTFLARLRPLLEALDDQEDALTAAAHSSGQRLADLAERGVKHPTFVSPTATEAAADHNEQVFAAYRDRVLRAQLRAVPPPGVEAGRRDPQ